MRGYSLPWAAHPPYPFPPLIHAIYDITVLVKKVAQNTAVLASYVHMYVLSNISQKTNYIGNIAWLQSNMRKL